LRRLRSVLPSWSFHGHSSPPMRARTEPSKTRAQFG
jgi:hypothetical protein